jgi:hypothetical protein
MRGGQRATRPPRPSKFKLRHTTSRLISVAHRREWSPEASAADRRGLTGLRERQASPPTRLEGRQDRTESLPATRRRGCRYRFPPHRRRALPSRTRGVRRAEPPGGFTNRNSMKAERDRRLQRVSPRRSGRPISFKHGARKRENQPPLLKRSRDTSSVSVRDFGNHDGAGVHVGGPLLAFRSGRHHGLL